MKKNNSIRFRILFSWMVVLFWTSVLIGQSAMQDVKEIPHLQKAGTAAQLIVHGRPFLMLGGELGNSSASDLKYMADVWPKLKAMRLNTILMPVSWEVLEPQEGKFDFALVDSLILMARKNDLKIVVLWFGSWKNSMSCYAPSWVKTDFERFPRSRTKNGKALEILTPFSDENRITDANAFRMMMKHLRLFDGSQQTVVMVQVENEIGMIPDARDYCPAAEKVFTQHVPEGLMTYLQKHQTTLGDVLGQTWQNAGMKPAGTWEEVFGRGLQTDEIFMAWYFARYTNSVAEAGKKEYPLPMYVNAALIRPGYKPGQYPSAGPLPHLMDVWKAAATQIDFLAPDIYHGVFSEWCSMYDQPGNPLFIPEVSNVQSAANAFYIFARHNALGYSPFSIENVANPESNQFHHGYEVLHQLAPLILENQGKGTMAGFLLDSAAQTAQITLGDYTFTVKHEYSWPYAMHGDGPTPRFGGMIIQVSKNEFYIAGGGVLMTFQSASNDGMMVGIAGIDEGKFTNGKWIAGRRLNGDENHQGRHLHLPGREYGIQKVLLYKYR
jgi:beta-galactosidase GanA